MRIPKKYGSYKVDSCPFCGMQATLKNSQDVPVCRNHKDSLLEDLKCVCGEWVDVKSGKYGVYFVCLNCGNQNFNKIIEFNRENFQIKSAKAKKANEYKHEPKLKEKQERKPKEITIRSDEVDFI